MNPTPRWTALLAAALLAGCGAGTVRDLEVTRLGRVEVTAADAEHLRISAELEITNPRDVAARIRDLSYQLAVGGGFIAFGRLEGENEIPAGGSRSFTLPLRVPFAAVTEEDFAAVLGPEIPYRLTGTAMLLEPVERDRIRLDLQGTVPAPARVEARLDRRSSAPFLSEPVVGTDLAGLVAGRGVVEVELTNPFRFPLRIAELDYEVELGGDPIGRGAIARDAVLEPGVNRLELPIRGSPLRALGGIASGLLGDGRLDVEVSGVVVIRRGERRLSIHLVYDPAE